MVFSKHNVPPEPRLAQPSVRWSKSRLCELFFSRGAAAARLRALIARPERFGLSVLERAKLPCALSCAGLCPDEGDDAEDAFLEMLPCGP